MVHIREEGRIQRNVKFVVSLYNFEAVWQMQRTVLGTCIIKVQSFTALIGDYVKKKEKKRVIPLVPYKTV